MIPILNALQQGGCIKVYRAHAVLYEVDGTPHKFDRSNISRYMSLLQRQETSTRRRGELYRYVLKQETQL